MALRDERAIPEGMDVRWDMQESEPLAGGQARYVYHMETGCEVSKLCEPEP